MKINDFTEMIDYCQQKRDKGSCPLMEAYKESGCLVRELCNSFGSGSQVFYFKHIWSLISDDALSVECGISKKGDILKKYEKMGKACKKARYTTDYEYCGNRCGKFTQHLCKKHLHHSLGSVGMSAVFINMEEVYPIVKWVFDNLEEFKNVN